MLYLTLWLFHVTVVYRSFVLHRMFNRMFNSGIIYNKQFSHVTHRIQTGLCSEVLETLHKMHKRVCKPVLSCSQDVDKWSFDVFTLHEASSEHALKFLVYELLTRYDLINRFRVCEIVFTHTHTHTQTHVTKK